MRSSKARPRPRQSRRRVSKSLPEVNVVVIVVAVATVEAVPAVVVVDPAVVDPVRAPASRARRFDLRPVLPRPKRLDPSPTKRRRLWIRSIR